MSSKYLFSALLILVSASCSQSYGSGEDAAIDSEGFMLPTSACNSQKQNTNSANNRSSSGFASRFGSARVSPQNDPLVRIPLNGQSPNNSLNNSTNNSSNGRISFSFNNSATTSPALNALLFECMHDGQPGTISALAGCVQQEQEEEKRIQVLVDDFFTMQKTTDNKIRNLLFNKHDHIDDFLKAVKPVDAAQSPMVYYGAAVEYFTKNISRFPSSDYSFEVINNCTKLENIASSLNAKGKLPQNITYKNDRSDFLELDFF